MISSLHPTTLSLTGTGDRVQAPETGERAHTCESSPKGYSLRLNCLPVYQGFPGRESARHNHTEPKVISLDVGKFYLNCKSFHRQQNHGRQNHPQEMSNSFVIQIVERSHPQRMQSLPPSSFGFPESPWMLRKTARHIGKVTPVGHQWEVSCRARRKNPYP